MQTPTAPTIHQPRTMPCHRAAAAAVLALSALAGAASMPPAPKPNHHPLLLTAAKPADTVTPAEKLLEVTLSVAGETAVLLAYLKVASLLILRRSSGEPMRTLGWAAICWFVLLQASSRVQGVMQSPTETLSPEWYDQLVKPKWNPRPWAFPLVWIPLKLMQTASAAVLWRRIGLKALESPAVVLFVLHVALGDVWNAQCMRASPTSHNAPHCPPPRLLRPHPALPLAQFSSSVGH